MTGPCAKQQVICQIRSPSGDLFYGTNDCLNPRPTCPREPGEGYEKCKIVCQQLGHAEEMALYAAGNAAEGATATIWGHYYACGTCSRLLGEAGVTRIEFAGTRPRRSIRAP